MSYAAQAMVYAKPRHNAHSHYQEMEITTADPFELILILYRGAVHRLQSSLDAFEAKNIERRATDINKAVEMIAELKGSLDFERGQQIAVQLDRLYSYMLRRLSEANCRQDANIVREVINLLKTLESAWDGAREKTRQERGGGEHVRLSA